MLHLKLEKLSEVTLLGPPFADVSAALPESHPRCLAVRGPGDPLPRFEPRRDPLFNKCRDCPPPPVRGPAPRIFNRASAAPNVAECCPQNDKGFEPTILCPEPLSLASHPSHDDAHGLVAKARRHIRDEPPRGVVFRGARPSRGGDVRAERIRMVVEDGKLRLQGFGTGWAGEDCGELVVTPLSTLGMFFQPFRMEHNEDRDPASHYV